MFMVTKSCNLGRLLLLIAMWLPLSALALDPIYTGSFSNKAIHGYDPVAYFESNKPKVGKSKHAYKWNGATWLFSSARNRDAFTKSPEKYAPQYGGYCAWAVSQGYTASIDPEAWYIREGKLYLNFSKSVQQKWLKDIPGNIKKGDINWPQLLARD